MTNARSVSGLQLRSDEVPCARSAESLIILHDFESESLALIQSGHSSRSTVHILTSTAASPGTASPNFSTMAGAFAPTPAP